MPAEPPPRSALETVERVHLVGIGGSGMSSLAALLAASGKRVSGSDLSAEAVARLCAAGINAAVGHRAELLDGAELVIRSAAVPADNPELVAAAQRGTPILSHAQALGELMQSKLGVGVAGTHGKTTTTALLGFILERAGLDPTVLVGATALNFGSGARLGHGRHLVVEADEYDRRFLALRPRLALITGIESDHLDYFRDLEEIVGAFRAFAEQVAPDGLLVTCADDPVLAALSLPGRRVTYGAAGTADWRLTDFQPIDGGGGSFRIVGPTESAEARLALNGRHNASNATGAVAAACLLGAPLEAALSALADFRGTERRFETVYRAGGIWVVDDYAHHPTAVRATLAAAREIHRGRLWAVFQPHTTNRVAALFDDFTTCFEPADRLTLLPIYRPAGREEGERAVTSADLAAAIRRPTVALAESLEAAEQALLDEIRPGDLALVMGAGDVTRVARNVAGRLGRDGPAR